MNEQRPGIAITRQLYSVCVNTYDPYMRAIHLAFPCPLLTSFNGYLARTESGHLTPVLYSGRSDNLPPSRAEPYSPPFSTGLPFGYHLRTWDFVPGGDSRTNLFRVSSRLSVRRFDITSN